MKHMVLRRCTVCGKRLMFEIEFGQGHGRDPLPRSKKVCPGECLRQWIRTRMR